MNSNSLMKRVFVVVIILTAGLVSDRAYSEKDDDHSASVIVKAQDKKLARVADYASTGFSTPPKSIIDLTTLLTESLDSDRLLAVKQMLDNVERPPSKALGSRDLVRFYIQRATDAMKLGRAKQEISDYRLALKHYNEDPFVWNQGPNGENRGYGHLLGNLGWALSMGGSNQEAIVLLRQSNDEASDGGKIYTSSTLAKLLARRGDLTQADKYIKKVQGYVSRVDYYSWDPVDFASARSVVAYSRAEVELMKGNYEEAISQSSIAVNIIRPMKDRRTRDELSKTKGVPDDTAIRVFLFGLGIKARSLSAAGRFIEAEIAEREMLVEALRKYGRYSVRTAYSIHILSRLMLEQGRYEDAENLSRVGLEIWRELEVPKTGSRYVQALIGAADIASLRGDWGRALDIYDEAIGNLSEDPQYAEMVVARNVNYALALIKSNNLSSALPILTKAHAESRATLGKKHQNTAELGGLLAVVKFRSGDTTEAQALFEQSLPVLFSRSRQSSDEAAAARDGRLAVIGESYIELLSGLTSEDSVSQAFEVAQLIRSRAVQGALNKSGARAAARDPQMAELARREQDAQKQVGALNGRLAYHLSLAASEHDEEVIEDLRVRIDGLRETRADLMSSLESGFPDYAKLINPKPLNLAGVQSYLREDEALISFYVGEERSYVWAMRNAGEVEFAPIEYGEAEIAQFVGTLRLALSPDAQTLGDIPEFDLQTGHALFGALLAPVESAWKDKAHLLVVPHKALGFLPLSVLPMQSTELSDETGPLFSNYQGVPWLIRDHSVTTLPSVASLRMLRDLPPANSNRLAFAGFANPLFSEEQALAHESSDAGSSDGLTSRGLGLRGTSLNLRSAPQTQELSSADLGQLPPLPDTQEEVEGIAQILGADFERDIFVGVSASEGRVKSADLSQYRVIAFATHGLVPGDLDGLTQPALAFSSPQVVGDEQDGLLTLGEILGLRLDADWVVLSACNTGMGEAAGAEALSGLGRAFFYAGTRALLVSNWPVETTSAKLLTVDLFKSQVSNPGLGRADALRQSMLSLLDSPGFLDSETNQPLFSYAHPIFWAPFTVVGEGASSQM